MFRTCIKAKNKDNEKPTASGNRAQQQVTTVWLYHDTFGNKIIKMLLKKNVYQFLKTFTI